MAGKVLKSCDRDFKVLLLCIFIIITLGGSLIFYAESTFHGIESPFESVPASFWWSIQTITTVGYGDLVPITHLGRIITCGFMLVGVATLALPILTIVLQFVTLYPKNIQMATQSATEHVGGSSSPSMTRALKPIRRASRRGR